MRGREKHRLVRQVTWLAVRIAARQCSSDVPISEGGFFCDRIMGVVFVKEFKRMCGAQIPMREHLARLRGSSYALDRCQTACRKNLKSFTKKKD